MPDSRHLLVSAARRVNHLLISLAALGVLVLIWADRASALAPLGYETAVQAGGSWSVGDAHAKAGGATWSYIEARWDGIEATQGVQNWNSGSTDDRVKSARENGLSIVLVVWGTPYWAVGNECAPYCAPTNPENYRQFVAAIQAKYQPEAIQVWNEPNTWHFGRETATGMPVSTYYSKIFTPAYQALSGTTTMILAPGTAATLSTQAHDYTDNVPEGGTWYQTWLRSFTETALAGGLTKWNIAQHMYAFNQANGTPIEQITKIAQFSRQLANEKEMGAVWPTEVGVSTGPKQYSEADQSSALSYVYCHVVGTVAPMMVYRHTDNDAEQTPPTYGFGTAVWQSGSGTWYNKPAYNALRQDHKSANECPPA